MSRNVALAMMTTAAAFGLAAGSPEHFDTVRDARTHSRAKLKNTRTTVAAMKRAARKAKNRSKR